MMRFSLLLLIAVLLGSASRAQAPLATWYLHATTWH
jgi:hypothetical protein